MKILFWAACVIICTILLFIAIMNINNSVNLALINHHFLPAISFQPSNIKINTALLLLIYFAGGKFVMLSAFLPMIMKKNEKESAYERRLEKTAVSNDESSAKVKVLEAKIEVLEKALKDALNRK